MRDNLEIKIKSRKKISDARRKN